MDSRTREALSQVDENSTSVDAAAIAPSVEGTPAVEPVPNELPSIHEQIKADRARAKADEENDSKARYWDRDADGKRPWDLPKETR
jgi:hypothetical protein